MSTVKNVLQSSSPVLLIVLVVLSIFYFKMDVAFDKFKVYHAGTVSTNADAEAKLRADITGLELHVIALTQENDALTVNTAPYTPVTLLSVPQESKCLALALYGEAANQSPKARLDLAWAIVNRAEDPRRSRQYRGSVCGAVISGKGSAINSIRPYMDAIKNTILFGNTDYVPPSARADKPKMEQEAWHAIELLAVEIMQGKHPKTTTANHFLAPRGVANWDNWADDLMPVGKAGNHILFRDYSWDASGKLVTFTASRQYMSKKHDNAPEDILRTPPQTVK